MTKNNWLFILLITTLLILTVSEFLAAFLLLHFPVNQELAVDIEYGYFLHFTIPFIRLALLIVIMGLIYVIYKKLVVWQKVVSVIFIVIYLAIFYIANYYARADIHFKDQKNTISLPIANNVVPEETIVLGVVVNDEARAYPVDYLAYHHKVYDSVGGEPLIVTYCSVCRSGRAFSSVVDGKAETFRLVGMRSYNAIIEDQSTKSWWQQATGEALIGKRKGEVLDEYVVEQMALSSWLNKHPETLILQPDSNFTQTYENYDGFATGWGAVNKREDESWNRKSWVVGVVHGGSALAIDYKKLTEDRLVHTAVGNHSGPLGDSILVAVELDSLSVHAWNTKVDTLSLHFTVLSDTNTMKDIQTGSIWNLSGQCISGSLEGKSLTSIPSYVEYWHSWKEFHPDTERWGNLDASEESKEIED